MRVAIVAEYYPRAADPVLGVWAHRQALAARDAGADVRVLVLHRPVPSKAALRAREPRALIEPLRQPLRTRLDGIEVTYVPFLAPAAAALVRELGRVGGAEPGAGAPAAAAELPLRPRPRPLRRAGRATPCGARGPARRS